MGNAGEFQKQYWSRFRKHLKESGSFLQPLGNVLPLSWHAFRLGDGNERIEVVISSRGEARIELYLTGKDARRKYAILREQCNNDLQCPKGMIWPTDEFNRQKAYLVESASLFDLNKWDGQFEWMRINMEAMYHYFTPKLEKLK